jgi:CRP-like cAMP-binding protein
MTLQLLKKGESVFKQGSHGDSFFIIQKGAVDAVINGKAVARITAGRGFGDLELLKPQKRAATITAVEDCVLMKLVKKDFDRILLAEENKKNKKKVDFLMTLPLFEGLSRREANTIASSIKSKIYPKGKTVIREGKESSRVFAVMKGKLEVQWGKRAQHSAPLKRVEGWPVTTGEINYGVETEIKPGMTVGAGDLLRGRPYSFTAKATEGGVTGYSFKNGVYQQLLVRKAVRLHAQALAKVTAREKAEASTNYRGALFGGLPLGRRLGWDGPLRPGQTNQKVNTAILEDEGETLARMSKQGSEGHFLSQADIDLPASIAEGSTFSARAAKFSTLPFGSSLDSIPAGTRGIDSASQPATAIN